MSNFFIMLLFCICIAQVLSQTTDSITRWGNVVEFICGELNLCECCDSALRRLQLQQMRGFQMHLLRSQPTVPLSDPLTPNNHRCFLLWHQLKVQLSLLLWCQVFSQGNGVLFATQMTCVQLIHVAVFAIGSAIWISHRTAFRAANLSPFQAAHFQRHCIEQWSYCGLGAVGSDSDCGLLFRLPLLLQPQRETGLCRYRTDGQTCVVPGRRRGIQPAVVESILRRIVDCDTAGADYGSSCATHCK